MDGGGRGWGGGEGAKTCGLHDLSAAIWMEHLHTSPSSGLLRTTLFLCLISNDAGLRRLCCYLNITAAACRSFDIAANRVAVSRIKLQLEIPLRFLGAMSS
jgi:hypothetical protein